MPPSKRRVTVLIIDADCEQRDKYQSLLATDPHHECVFFQASDGHAVASTWHEAKPDCVLLAEQLPDMDALTLLKQQTRELDCFPLPVVVFIADGNEAMAAEALKMGAQDYLVKSQITNDTLQRAVHHTIEKSALRRRLEIANYDLVAKNKKLRELTETAHRFVDNVAHEFRTRLTVMQEFTSIIADGIGGPVTEQQREYLQFTEAAARNLAQMVDDMLDSSKLKARTLRVDRRPHDVEDIIEAVRPFVTTSAESKKIRLEEAIEPNLGQIFCDFEKVVRILVNLTVNAIKFSPEGGQIRSWARFGEHSDVQVGVTDEGPGLPPQELNVICDRFKQVGDPQRSSAKGFGLGLNIAKELIWLNLGTMDIQSTPGQGSTFAVTFCGCDPHQILSRYVEQMSGLESTVSLTLLQAVPCQGASAEQIRRFLVSMCYPTDLCLNTIDSSSVILIGATTEPDRWISRLQAAQVESMRHPSTQAAGYEIRWLGTWSYPELKQTIVGSAMDRILGVKACA